MRIMETAQERGIDLVLSPGRLRITRMGGENAVEELEWPRGLLRNLVIRIGLDSVVNPTLSFFPLALTFSGWGCECVVHVYTYDR